MKLISKNIKYRSDRKKINIGCHVEISILFLTSIIKLTKDIYLWHISDYTHVTYHITSSKVSLVPYLKVFSKIQLEDLYFFSFDRLHNNSQIFRITYMSSYVLLTCIVTCKLCSLNMYAFIIFCYYQRLIEPNFFQN